MKLKSTFVLVMTLLLVLVVGVQKGFVTDIEKNRDSVADKYKWDLTHLYADMDSWKKGVGDVSERMKKIGSYEGKLGNSAGDLLEALDYYHDVHKQYIRLMTYAFQLI